MWGDEFRTRDGQRRRPQAGVIHTEDLTKVYPGTDFAAVDRLNLDIPAGEIFGLLGPNGAGKPPAPVSQQADLVPVSAEPPRLGVVHRRSPHRRRDHLGCYFPGGRNGSDRFADGQ